MFYEIYGIMFSFFLFYFYFWGHIIYVGKWRVHADLCVWNNTSREFIFFLVFRGVHQLWRNIGATHELCVEHNTNILPLWLVTDLDELWFLLFTCCRH